MLKFIDYLLDRLTMYRLVLYVLIALLSVASVLSFIGLIKISYVAIIFSSVFLTLVCYVTNKVFAYVFKVPANVESVYITALILALIISPTTSIFGSVVMFWAGVLAMSAKFILAINKRHIFNPAAIAVLLTGLGLGGYASWWVGTFYMAPAVLILGFLVARKIRREDMILSFFTVSISAGVIYGFLGGNANLISILQRVLFETPIVFFGFIMLTEPLTSPARKNLQVIYGAITGLLITPQFGILGYHFAPEAALIVGNIFSYIFSPNYKLFLNLTSKNKLSKDTYEFNFPKSKNFSFIPGQYMEWALPHAKTDSRGNRRYFSLSSSPTENRISVTVKFYENSSSYKKELLEFQNNSEIVAASLAGDFTIPKDLEKPLVFIAGGVGITPFRSMVKYIVDNNLKCNIIILYSNRTEEEILFKDIWDSAESLGLKTLYVLTDVENLPKNWQGPKGHIDEDLIKKEIPDYKTRIFYISGPQGMVKVFEELLRKMKLPRSQIKTDFFPGYTAS